MVNNCHKVIMSDAHIKNNAIYFIENRKGKTIYVKNNFKKYEGIHAYFVKDEVMFLNKLLERITNDECFFFGCDSKRTTQDYYNKCWELATEEQRSRFILIVKDTNFKLENATEQFKNKFVFYSPKMVYGVDFNNIDVAVDVFIYIKGHTISPSESFQQATRCRNIRNLYFYGVDKNSKVDFRTLEEVEEHYRNNIDLCKMMKLMTTYYNESDEEQYLEGSFLN